MKHYLLDTDIISYLADSNSPYRVKVKEHLLSLTKNDKVSISIITLYELTYGLNSFNGEDKHREIFKVGIEFVKKYLDILPLDIQEIDIFSKLKSSYKSDTGIQNRANKKNDLDFLIASTAINHKAILVSNDSIFKQLAKLEPTLKYKNWVDEI